MAENPSNRETARPIRPQFLDDDGNEIPAPRPRVWLAVAETLLVFLAIFLHGATLPPDLNEVHYLGKARHYWNPAWCQGDFFLETADAHQVFYWTFGWLTLDRFGLSLDRVAWIGRLATWVLLAIAWRRLSWAVVPRPVVAVVTAVLFLALVARCHMAGEWIVGGVEAKGFAYAMVLFGLGSLVQQRWRTAIVLFGAATAFHVLVGGWSLVALAIAWVLLRGTAPTPIRLVPALIAAAVLAAPSVWFALELNLHGDGQTGAAANAIYVYDRLPHHLVLTGMKPEFIVRFVVLILIGVGLVLGLVHNTATRKIAAFGAAAVAIALVGAVLSMAVAIAPDVTSDPMAAVLRFYWFRLADIVVPLAVTLLAAARIEEAYVRNAVRGSYLAAAVLLVTAAHLAVLLYERRPGTEIALYSPADAKSRVAVDGRTVIAADDWIDVCHYFRDRPHISPAAKVLTPRNSHSFKWHAERPEVGTWKDIPQDAASIVEWMERMQTIHANRDKSAPARRWSRTLGELGAEELTRVAQKYGAEYIVSEAEPPVDLPKIHGNRSYSVYRIVPEPRR